MLLLLLLLGSPEPSQTEDCNYPSLLPTVPKPETGILVNKQKHELYIRGLIIRGKSYSLEMKEKGRLY